MVRSKVFCLVLSLALMLFCLFPVIGTAATDIVYQYDFEAGWGPYYADNGVWEIGVPTSGPNSCYSGSQCAATVLSGNYPDDTDSRLVSPSVILPSVTGDEEIHLRFWQWFSYAGYDGGQVQISVYDSVGGTWSAWENIGNSIDTISTWSLMDVDLTVHAGKKVRIAFYHTAWSPGGSSTGWYIDDIQIIKKVPEFIGTFETGWGDWSGDRGVWQIGTPTVGPKGCYSGTQCATTGLNGNYPDDTDSRLVSPSIMLPAVASGEEIHLRFWQWFSYAGYDGGQVQISVYDSANSTWAVWANIGPSISASSYSWSPLDIDLTEYASKKIRIAFYHSAWSPGGSSTGWYIDDINLWPPPDNTYYCDLDGDGYYCKFPNGTCAPGVNCPPAGCSLIAGDDCVCNDYTVHPDASETCDGKDNDCNTGTLDGWDETWYDQPTMCGVGVCKNSGQWSCLDGQKVDTCEARTPTETPESTCDDGLDNDCDGKTDTNDPDCPGGCRIVSIPDDLTGNTGETVYIPVNVDNANGIAGFEMTITESVPAVLNCTSASAGTCTGACSVLYNPSTGEVAGFCTTPLQGTNCSVAKVCCQVVGCSNGLWTELTLSGVKLVDEAAQEICSTIDNGKFSCGPPCYLGDMDQNLFVDISDVILVLRCSLNLPIASPCLPRGDINCDDVIDISDVILTLRKALGIDLPEFCSKCN